MVKDFIFFVFSLLQEGTVFLPKGDASVALGSKLAVSGFQWARNVLIDITVVFVFIFFLLAVQTCIWTIGMENWMLVPLKGQFKFNSHMRSIL